MTTVTAPTRGTAFSPAQVVGDRAAAGGDIDGAALTHHTPCAVPLRERERGAALASGEQAGGLGGVALDD